MRQTTMVSCNFIYVARFPMLRIYPTQLPCVMLFYYHQWTSSASAFKSSVVESQSKPEAACETSNGRSSLIARDCIRIVTYSTKYYYYLARASRALSTLHGTTMYGLDASSVYTVARHSEECLASTDGINLLSANLTVLVSGSLST